MPTTTELMTTTGVEIITDQDFDLEIPVSTGLMRQGDVLIRPAKTIAETPVPPSGVAVVRSEASSNTHTIFAADGPVFCNTEIPARGSSLLVATLSVPKGSTAYLAHPEHGFLGIGAGTYEIRRQREQAEKIRMVAD